MEESIAAAFFVLILLFPLFVLSVHKPELWPRFLGHVLSILFLVFNKVNKDPEYLVRHIFEIYKYLFLVCLFL